MTTLTCGHLKTTVKFSPIDERLLAKMHASSKLESAPAIMRLVWASGRVHAPSSTSDELRRTTIELIEVWEKDNEILDYKYTHTYQVPGNQLELGAITRSSSGHRLEDDLFHFYALGNGHGYCDWEKWGVNPVGKGVKISVEDCRRRKTIMTSNHGLIKITKRKIKSEVGSKLKSIIQFIDACPGGEMTWTWAP